MFASPPRLSQRARRAARTLSAFCVCWALATAPARASAPADVRIANVRDNQFSISWVSAVAETGFLRWGTDPGSLSARAEDDRGAGATSTTHHATVSGLTAATTYYVDVVSGGTVDDNGGAHYRVTTGPLLDPASPSPPAYGKVSRFDGSPSTGILVYGTLRDADGRGSPGSSSLLSSIVQDVDQDYWHLELGPARLADLSRSFAYSASGDKLDLRLVGGPGQTLDLTLDTGTAAPATPVTLPAPPPPATVPPAATATQPAATASPTAGAPTATATAAPIDAATATATSAPAGPTVTAATAVATGAATPERAPTPDLAPPLPLPTATGAPATPLVLPAGSPSVASPTAASTPSPASPAAATPAPVPAAATVTPSAPASAPPSLPEWLPAVLAGAPLVVLLLLVVAKRRGGA